MIITRFAPSPTGLLHLGHAFSAILAHDHAVARGGRFLLRIEDIDGTRSRAEHVAAILDDLAWLGLGWDGPIFQSDRLARYDAALDRLKAAGLVYRCFCTRAEIAASLSAPHGPATIYPGICRRLDPAEAEYRAGEPHCWRLNMGRAVAITGPLTWHDATAGIVTVDAPIAVTIFSPPPPGGGGRHRLTEGEVSDYQRWASSPSVAFGATSPWRGRIGGGSALAQGDVVLARKDAPASYHLAVTVDDAAQGVTDVVRGVDLFAATHVHRVLQALLDLPTPRYHHHALLADAEGTRLAKRNNSPSLSALRLAGEDGVALADRLRAGIGFGLVKD